MQVNRKTLESRERGKWKHARWYAFGRSQNLGEMEQKKILTPSIANRASFTLDSGNFYYFVGSGGGGGGGYGVTLKPGERMAYEYFLGLLNSRLLDAFLKSYSSPFSGGYYAFNRQYIAQLPIRVINFDDAHDVVRYRRVVALVEQMLELHKQRAAAQTAADRELFQRQIDATDAQIDALVYALYGLTEEEIAVVEG
ncbi:MAG: TaqI-like C-terminal specificity domain-containing protein [Chloroflexota bacterium]